MDLEPMQVVEFLASLTVGAGTSTIVKSIIKENVPTETLISKITVNAAAFVLGAMAAKETKKYTRGQVKKLHKMFIDAEEKAKEAETEEIESITTEQ